MHFGNGTSLFGYKNTQRGTLRAFKSLKGVCRGVFENFLKCYIYCMSGQSLHRQSTDCPGPRGAGTGPAGPAGPAAAGPMFTPSLRHDDVTLALT